MLSRIETIIKKLHLERHCEGGYFRRTYCAELMCHNQQGQVRAIMSSIYYLVTHETGMSYFAVNQSDLILYHHDGAPLRIVFLDQKGELSEVLLGSDLIKGQTPQVLCPGGVWKAYDLMGADYALVSEAVAPGFDYEDMQMPTQAELIKRAPEHEDRLKHYIFKG